MPQPLSMNPPPIQAKLCQRRATIGTDWKFRIGGSRGELRDPGDPATCISKWLTKAKNWYDMTTATAQQHQFGSRATNYYLVSLSFGQILTFGRVPWELLQKSVATIQYPLSTGHWSLVTSRIRRRSAHVLLMNFCYSCNRSAVGHKRRLWRCRNCAHNELRHSGSRGGEKGTNNQGFKKKIYIVQLN